jgi:rare lipoprotein A
MLVLAAGATTAPPLITPPAPAPWEPELPAMAAPESRDQFGLASWYGDWHHGRETATGEPFDQWALTAAHLTLPFGSDIEVTNIANGRRVRVRINDRGPVIAGRVLDLSRAAAARLDAIDAGVVLVRIRVVAAPEKRVASVRRP